MASVDPMTGALSYRCRCGKEVQVEAAAMRPGSVDYCGCGGKALIMDRVQINRHREMAGLPELDEK